MTAQIHEALKRHNYNLWRFAIPLEPERDLERYGWGGQDGEPDDGGEDGIFDFPCQITAGR